jgi:hypothetical protein
VFAKLVLETDSYKRGRSIEAGISGHGQCDSHRSERHPSTLPEHPGLHKLPTASTKLYNTSGIFVHVDDGYSVRGKGSVDLTHRALQTQAKGHSILYQRRHSSLHPYMSRSIVSAPGIVVSVDQYIEEDHARSLLSCVLFCHLISRYSQPLLSSPSTSAAAQFLASRTGPGVTRYGVVYLIAVFVAGAVVVVWRTPELLPARSPSPYCRSPRNNPHQHATPK